MGDCANTLLRHFTQLVSNACFEIIRSRPHFCPQKVSETICLLGLLNRFSVDVKDGFNLFEQKLYINVSYINRANNGNSANSDLFMISTAFVQGVWTPPGKAILTEQILQSRSTWAIKWVSNWISHKSLWFCSWNSYTTPGRYMSGEWKIICKCQVT